MFVYMGELRKDVLIRKPSVNHQSNRMLLYRSCHTSFSNCVLHNSLLRSSLGISEGPALAFTYCLGTPLLSIHLSLLQSSLNRFEIIRLISRSLMLGNHPPGMNHAWDPAKNGKQDIDEEIGVAAGLEEDSQWWQEEGEEVEADVARAGWWCVCHCGSMWSSNLLICMSLGCVLEVRQLVQLEHESAIYFDCS